MQSGSLAAAPSCVLEATIGVPGGHKASVSPLDLKTSEEGFAPYLRESMKTDRPVLLTTEEGTLSSELIEGLEWRGFGGKTSHSFSLRAPVTLAPRIWRFWVLVALVNLS